MDCPWCGCGWLFTCVTCRKAFAFAEGVEVDSTWEEIARQDLGGWSENPSSQDIKDWVEVMRELLADVEPHRQYVYLDGQIIPADVTKFVFDGWYAHHEFNSLPHVAAMNDKTLVEKLLANPDYWICNALADEG